MDNLRELIPLNLVLIFLIIIGVEFLISTGLVYYNQHLQSQIATLKQSLNTKEEALKEKLVENEAYQAFSQFANIIEIVKRKKSVYDTFQKLLPLIPKFVELEKVEIETDKNRLVLSGYVSNWIDYVKLHRYFSTHPKLMLESFKSPFLDEKTGKINFEFDFRFKPNFYQE